jgi:perosamine synthetase
VKIPLSKPDITDIEKKKVLEVLETSSLSLGPKLKEFEEKIAKYAGVKYAIAVNSGTSALHLIIRALDIKDNDEIITTPFSFISSSNCALFEKAKPVFVDINSETLNIDVSKIEEKINEKTKAILAVDVFGNPADWNELKSIAIKHDLHLIEDSAEALGSTYNGKRCGSFGDVGVFAFYPNKQITTGEGGVVLTNNKMIATQCYSMTNQGRRVENGKWLEHIRLGYNYRLDELSCALGVAQLSRVEEILNKRKAVAEAYNNKLKDISEIKVPNFFFDKRISPFVYVIILNDNFSEKDRNIVIAEMNKKDIQCGFYFQSIHLQPFYREMFGYTNNDFPITEKISQRTIALPFFNNLKEEEIIYVVESLRETIEELK